MASGCALCCLFVPASEEILSLAVFTRGWSHHQASFDVDRCLKKRRDVCVDVTLKLHGRNNGNLSSQILLRRLSVCMTTHTHYSLIHFESFTTITELKNILFSDLSVFDYKKKRGPRSHKVCRHAIFVYSLSLAALKPPSFHT